MSHNFFAFRSVATSFCGGLFRYCRGKAPQVSSTQYPGRRCAKANALRFHMSGGLPLGASSSYGGRELEPCVSNADREGSGFFFNLHRGKVGHPTRLGAEAFCCSSSVVANAYITLALLAADFWFKSQTQLVAPSETYSATSTDHLNAPSGIFTTRFVQNRAVLNVVDDFDSPSPAQETGRCHFAVFSAFLQA